MENTEKGNLWVPTAEIVQFVLRHEKNKSNSIGTLHGVYVWGTHKIDGLSKCNSHTAMLVRSFCIFAIRISILK